MELAMTNGFGAVTGAVTIVAFQGAADYVKENW